MTVCWLETGSTDHRKCCRLHLLSASNRIILNAINFAPMHRTPHTWWLVVPSFTFYIQHTDWLRTRTTQLCAEPDGTQTFRLKVTAVGVGLPVLSLFDEYNFRPSFADAFVYNFNVLFRPVLLLRHTHTLIQWRRMRCIISTLCEIVHNLWLRYFLCLNLWARSPYSIFTIIIIKKVYRFFLSFFWIFYKTY